ncbi:MAG: hypothetical protein KatS3mg105_1556 [Gemmatales bacterium]|nr:MAG: hypothetical protein KatS3mg105_1556 [Gemmatales bacterium]
MAKRMRTFSSARLLAIAAVLSLIGLVASGPAEAQQSSKTASTSKAAPAPELPIVSIPQVMRINELIEQKWKDNEIRPAEICSDYEFIRRATLDILGRIATPEEIAQFMREAPQSRRASLIDRLLASEEYVDNWATIWTTWLLTRSANPLNRDQMQVWLAEQFSDSYVDPETGQIKKKAEPTGWDDIVRGLITAKGMNNENGAVNFILQHLGEPTPRGQEIKDGMFDFVPITSRITRIFLGIQIQCTQCHDHPFNPEWKQKHFWGMNTFLRQVRRIGTPARRNNRMNVPIFGLQDDESLNKENMIYFENRKAVGFMRRSEYLDGSQWKVGSNKTRREALAEFIINDPFFAKAYVNRMWAHFFGRGLTVNKEFDDFGQHNEVVHPELLEYLAEEFRKVNYDHRELIRWICNSKPYNLACTANETNEKKEDEVFFSRMLLKSMSPEQLFESIWVSTYAYGQEKATVDETRRDLRERWLNQLVVSFGDDEGNEQTFNGTVIQALMLMNGNDINAAIESKDGPVAAAMAKGSWPAVVDHLFLIVLNRKPTTAEQKQIFEDIKPVLIREDTRRPEFWRKAAQDLFWALLNSSEFILNH